MKAIELLQYLKNGMDVGYPPKHIINNAIKEVKELEALIEDSSKSITHEEHCVLQEVLEHIGGK